MTKEAGLLWRILWVLEDIRAELREQRPKAKSATLSLGGNKMPLTINVGGKATAAPPAFKEWDGPNGTGNQVPPVGPLNYTSDNTAVATIDTSGAIAGVAAGTANITVTDAGNNLSATDVLTVQAVAVSATLALATA